MGFLRLPNPRLGLLLGTQLYSGMRMAGGGNLCGLVAWQGVTPGPLPVGFCFPKPAGAGTQNQRRELLFGVHSLWFFPFRGRVGNWHQGEFLRVEGKSSRNPFSCFFGIRFRLFQLWGLARAALSRRDANEKGRA